jgi:hypothetical protein
LGGWIKFTNAGTLITVDEPKYFPSDRWKWITSDSIQITSFGGSYAESNGQLISLKIDSAIINYKIYELTENTLKMSWYDYYGEENQFEFILSLHK